MAKITRSGPLAGVRLIDFATVVMGPCAAQIFGDLGGDVIKPETPPDTLRGRESKSISKLPLGEPSEDPQLQPIEAAEKTYGSHSYAELSEERDPRNWAC